METMWLPSGCVFAFDRKEMDFDSPMWPDCPLCATRTVCLSTETYDSSASNDYWSGHYSLYQCRGCCWWTLRHHSGLADPSVEAYRESSPVSVAGEFQIGDKDIPLSHLRRYVQGNPESVSGLHPRKVEELIASIFREHGFRVELTAYSNDGGVDLILFESNAQPTAVQVKRYRTDRKVRVEEVRDFLGAMVLGGYAKGIFLTTGHFTRGARRVMLGPRLAQLGIEMKPIDAEGVTDLVHNLSPRPVREPWDVAWLLRKCVPNSETEPGDWGPFGWPLQLPSEEQIERWYSEFHRLLHSDPMVQPDPLLLTGTSIRARGQDRVGDSISVANTSCEWHW